MAPEQFSNDAATTLTADPGVGGTTLTVASAAAFPAAPQFRVRVDAELMVVTAGAGTTTWTVTRGAEGTVAAAHAAGAAVTHVLTAGALLAGIMERPPAWQPGDGAGLLTWAYDPEGSNGAQTAPTAGQLVLVRQRVTQDTLLTGGGVVVMGAASGATALANCYVAAIDRAGVTRGVSADQAAAWTTTGGKRAAYTANAGQTLLIAGTDRWYWIGVLVGTQSTTPMQLMRGTAAAYAHSFDLTATSDPPARVLSRSGVGAAVPATVDLSTYTVPSTGWWAGGY